MPSAVRSGLNAVDFLRAAARDAEAGHHFVEDQKRAVPGAFLPQHFKKAGLRKIETGVGRDRLEDDRGDLAAVRAKSCAHRLDIVEGQSDRQVGECFRHAGAVGLAMRERAAAGVDEKRIDMAVIAAVEFDDLVAFVKPRARRTHDIVASVPLFTIRTFSIDGTQRQISSAISTSSGLGMPKLTPRRRLRRTASITTAGAWPRIAGPQVPT